MAADAEFRTLRVQYNSGNRSWRGFVWGSPSPNLEDDAAYMWICERLGKRVGSPLMREFPARWRRNDDLSPSPGAAGVRRLAVPLRRVPKSTAAKRSPPRLVRNFFAEVRRLPCLGRVDDGPAIPRKVMYSGHCAHFRDREPIACRYEESVDRASRYGSSTSPLLST